MKEEKTVAAEVPETGHRTTEGLENPLKQQAGEKHPRPWGRRVRL